MNKKLRTRSIYKLLAVLLLTCLVLSSLSMNRVSDAHAQVVGTDTPTPTSTPTAVFQGQIVGGTLASPGQWPWQVALVGSNAPANDFYSGPGFQFCSGSLIDPQWVITAAHCITNDSDGTVVSPSSLDVVAGIYDLLNPAAGFQRRHVIQIIRDPAFNNVSLDSDVALLKLDSPVTIGGSGATTTALVPLVPSNIGSLTGINSEATGWGNTISFGDPSGYPTQLHEVLLPIIANSTCNDASHWGGGVTANMLCAGYDAGGKDTCDGDSGGPLVVQNAGQWQLAGIVSWGSNQCGQPDLEGVYTRVSQFSSWVNAQINPVILGPAGPGIYDDTDPRWVYSSGWTAVVRAGPYNKTDHYATTLGSTAAFTFTGTAFTYYYVAASNRGNIQVYVDGTLITTLNAHSSSTVWLKNYTSPLFAYGTHTVTFAYGGPAGSTIDVDAIRVLNAYDDTDPSWTYSSGWLTRSGAGPYNATSHYTKTVGATASFPFTGSGFTFIYVTAVNRGKLRISVDGTLIATLNAHSASTVWRKAYNSPFLGTGPHTVTITHAGPAGTYIDVDEIQINP